MPCSAAFIPRSRRPEAGIPALLLVRESEAQAAPSSDDPHASTNATQRRDALR
jgi:hypothetical protein